MKKSRGFTLVEILIVSSLVVLTAVFFTSVFIDNNKKKLIDSYVSEFMVVSNAVRSYVHNNYGNWPDEQEVGDGEESCLDGFFILDSEGYLGGVVDNYTFSCLQVGQRMPVLKITRNYDDDSDTASWVAGLLPSATATDAGATLYIPKPRVAQIVETGLVGKSGDIIDMPVCRRPKINIMTKAVCAVESRVGGVPRPMGGYYVDASEVGTPEDKKWQVEMRVSYADAPSDFQNSYACDDIEFNYVVFCE